MKFKKIISGIASFFPFLYRLKLVFKGTSGSDSARYCYSVWMRHLVMLKINGLDPYPKVVAEFGPGDSLGIGLAALISGCDKYYGLDVVAYSSNESNAKIFDELLTLFKNRSPIPGDDEFPQVKPRLENYEFPSIIYDENKLNGFLEKDRIEKIRNSINNLQSKDSLIRYVVPWSESNIIEKESLDLIYSQSVLEYVADLKMIFKCMSFWLKANGIISHQIDFASQNHSDEWNGHWTISDFTWKFMKGKRPYYINREPHSTYISTLGEDFKIVCDKRVIRDSRYTLNDLSPRFKSLTETDLITSGSFIQGVKK